MKDEDEISAARDRAADLSYKASRYPGMSYEDGLRDALDLALGEFEDGDPTK